MYPGERFNSITHLVGTVLAIVGTAVLITLAAVYGRGDGRRMAALAVYGAMLVILYLSSTLYHSFRAGTAKRMLIWTLMKTDPHIIRLCRAGFTGGWLEGRCD